MLKSRVLGALSLPLFLFSVFAFTGAPAVTAGASSNGSVTARRWSQKRASPQPQCARRRNRKAKKRKGKKAGKARQPRVAAKKKAKPKKKAAQKKKATSQKKGAKQQNKDAQKKKKAAAQAKKKAQKEDLVKDDEDFDAQFEAYESAQERADAVADARLEGKAELDAQRVSVTARPASFSSSEPEPSLLTPGTDQIDYKALLNRAFTEAKRKLAWLRGQKEKRKAELKKARTIYVTESRRIKDWRKEQKKGVKTWYKAEKKRIEALPKDQRKAAKKALKEAYKKKRAGLKDASKNRKGTLKHAWKKAKRKYRLYRREIKKTQSEAKMIPKYAKKMKPEILKQLIKLNEKLMEATREAAKTAAGVAGSIATLAALNPDVIKFYMKYKAFERVAPLIEKGVNESLRITFMIADKIATAIIKVVTAAVGAIPFVGGVLAAAAAAAAQAVYSQIKATIRRAVIKVGKRVTDRLSTNIGNELYKLHTKNQPLAQIVASAARAAAEEALKSLKAANAGYAQAAQAAEAAARGVVQEAVAEGKAMAKEIEAEEREMASAYLEAEGAK